MFASRGARAQRIRSLNICLFGSMGIFEEDPHGPSCMRKRPCAPPWWRGGFSSRRGVTWRRSRVSLRLVDLSWIPIGVFFFGSSILPRKWAASQNNQNKAKLELELSNHGESRRSLIGTVRFAVRPHTPLGAATGLVAQFRCGLRGWLASWQTPPPGAARACVARIVARGPPPCAPTNGAEIQISPIELLTKPQDSRGSSCGLRWALASHALLTCLLSKELMWPTGRLTAHGPPSSVR